MTAKADETEAGRVRSYVVLGTVQPGAWHELGTVDAASAEGAARQTLEVLEAGGEELPARAVAVPARSWHPVAVALETQTRLRLTDVGTVELTLEQLEELAAEGGAA